MVVASIAAKYYAKYCFDFCRVFVIDEGLLQSPLLDYFYYMHLYSFVFVLFLFCSEFDVVA